MYEPFDKTTASVTDRIAWALCQIIDDDAPLRWTRYRFAAECIASNPEGVMDDLKQLAASKKPAAPASGGDALPANYVDQIAYQLQYNADAGYVTQTRFTPAQARAIAATLAARDGVWVPREPSPGLLVSMAMRLDHGYGMLPSNQQELMLRQMRQVHEEVVGAGFYSPEREAMYVAAAPKGEVSP